LQAARAFLRFWVRVQAFDGEPVLEEHAGPLLPGGGGGVAFPGPENVAEAGLPKTPGCGVGAGLHASPVLHGGGAVAGSGRHGALVVHSCASYTSRL
jgi:hypothetical protein